MPEHDHHEVLAPDGSKDTVSVPGRGVPGRGALFKALSDPGRRTLLDRLNDRNGLSLSDLCVDMGMTRQSVTKHLDVLEAANLVTAVRRGRERLHFLNAAPDQRHRRPLDPLLRPGAGGGPVGSQDGIGGHPHGAAHRIRLQHLHRGHARAGLAGLTDPDFTTRYWRHPASGGLTLRSDWKRARPTTPSTTRSGWRSPTPSR